MNRYTSNYNPGRSKPWNLWCAAGTVIKPNGAGKSAVYQAAAQALACPTVILSPFRALQKNQIEMLGETEVGGAPVINSSVSAVRKKSCGDLDEGGFEYMLLTPEQLAKPDILERVSAPRPALFVFDEAHCMSEWGHDFRPNLERIDCVRIYAEFRMCRREYILRYFGEEAPSITSRKVG